MLSQVRSAGTDKWTARCPAHEDHSPSLSIRQMPDRVLIHCHAGCSVTDICWALRVTVADLYSDCRYRSDPDTQRWHRAADGLETWRQAELQRIAEDLRTRDIIIRHIHDHAGVLTPCGAMILLACEYHTYPELEDRFWRLLRGEHTLEIWRECRRTA